MPHASLSNIKMAYEREGKGEPLLLIMGIGAQLIQWPPSFCTALCDLGFEVIRIDNRDSGLSSSIDSPLTFCKRTLLRFLSNKPIKAAYTLEDMSTDIVEFLDFIGLKSCHIVAISMGSMIAQIVAAKHPERVRSLTLMSSNTGKRRHFFIPPSVLKVLLPRGASKTKETYIKGFVELFEVIGSPKYQRSHTELSQFAEQAFERSYNPLGFSRQLRAVMATGDRERFYTKISCPTSLIHGILDPLTPIAGARILHKSIPNSRANFFPDLAHDIPEHFIPIFAKIIQETANESTH
jgi:pimeloyl-ACP methyl ester carboxylesterase